MSFLTNASLVLSVDGTAQAVEIPRIVDLSGNSIPITRNSHARFFNDHATQIAYVRVNHDGGAIDAATTAVGGYDYIVPPKREIIVSIGDTTQYSVIASGAATPVYLDWGKDT